MDILNTKRVRSSNWEEEEKRLLTQLVTERVGVIENKDTSTNTNSTKKAAWQEVLSCFNSLNSKQRNLTQIMTQWRNTKGKVKSRDSEYRRARVMTGGGPPPPSPPAEDLAIIQALPNEFIVDHNNFDSDSLYYKTLQQSQISESPSMLTDYNEPKTPVSSSANQLEESMEVIQILEDLEQPETEKLLITTPVSATNQQNKNRCKQVKILNNKNNKNEDYEQQLFLLAKKSKERENERAEEIHKKRLNFGSRTRILEEKN